jgi:hypothetical protein
MRAGSPDLFQTPPEALDPLYPLLPRDWRIWECACGEGNLVRALEGHGYSVIGTDASTDYAAESTDFLSADPPPGIDCILTNPPFSLKDDFLSRCYELGKPFALLLPLTGLEGLRRQELFRRHGVELVLMPRRLHFQTPNFTEGRKSSSWFATAWYCGFMGIGRSLTFWQPMPAQPALELVA